MATKDYRRAKEAHKRMKGDDSAFRPIDLAAARHVPAGMTRAFENNKYIVMVYDGAKVSTGTATQVLVQRLNNTPLLHHWREMQAIKNQLFGEETIAIEYYPKQSQLVDKHNIYWMWIYPESDLPVPII